MSEDEKLPTVATRAYYSLVLDLDISEEAVALLRAKFGGMKVGLTHRGIGCFDHPNPETDPAYRQRGLGKPEKIPR